MGLGAPSGISPFAFVLTVLAFFLNVAAWRAVGLGSHPEHSLSNLLPRLRVCLIFQLFFAACLLLALAFSHTGMIMGIAFAALITPAVFLVIGGRRVPGAVPSTSPPSVNPADKLNELKDQFVTLASHELRTPLSVINGFSEILLREKLGPLNEEQRRRLRKILSQGQRLNRIVDDLLDLSRIRSGKIEVRSDVFDLVPVLKSCLDDHASVCEQLGLTLCDDVPDCLPDVRGDVERVTQVVINLLNNAVKYTPAGGTVRLGASPDSATGRVRVEVRDTGIGVESSDLEKIFQEFYRVSSDYVRKSSGTGLGLTIVKQIVQAQGGEVGAASDGPGKGAVFFFTLPQARMQYLRAA